MPGQSARDGQREWRAIEMLGTRTQVIETGIPGEFIVASQSGKGLYRVRGIGVEGEIETCGCPDFLLRWRPCKHIRLVHLQLTPSSKSAGHGVGRRKQYPQNWSAYNKGQTEEIPIVNALLGDLVNEVPELPRLPGAGGRPGVPLREAILCSILKVYSGYAGRKAIGVYESARDLGTLHLEKVPSFMVASRVLNRQDITPILYSLLRVSAGPLADLEDDGIVAPDSTGMQSTSFGGWREARHGEKREHRWLKVHAIVGTKTHVIIDAVVAEANSGDAPQFEPLLRGALDSGFRPGFIAADSGYLSKYNYRLSGELGVQPRIAFRSNSLNRSGNRGSPSAWRKAYHLFHANPAGWDRVYHQRSNVESVFSALKRKFGENLRSRNHVAQVNEAICKLIAYNLTVVVHEIFEHGIAPQFNSCS